jgi:hypothetical protein
MAASVKNIKFDFDKKLALGDPNIRKMRLYVKKKETPG